MQKADYKYSIHSVEKTVRILELLAEGNGQMSVSQIAEALDSHISGITRFLLTLQQIGYVQKDVKTGRYALTDRLFLLSESLLAHHPLSKHYYDIMHAYAQQYDMSAHICAFCGRDTAILHKSIRPHTVTLPQAYFQPKQFLYWSAGGRILLADMPPEELDQYFTNAVFIKFQPKTLATEAEIRAELEKVRERGYAENDEEYTAGIYTIAFPLRVAGDLRGALTFICNAKDKDRISDPVTVRNIQILLGNQGE